MREIDNIIKYGKLSEDQLKQIINSYEAGKISEKRFTNLINQRIAGKTREEWVNEHLKNKDKIDLYSSLVFDISSKNSVTEELNIITTAFDNNIIDKTECSRLLTTRKRGRTREEWLEYHMSEGKSSPKLIIPIIILLLLVSSYIFFNPSLTGYVVSIAESNYTDDIEVSFDNYSEYYWYVENPGNINSIKLNGEFSSDAAVYIENDETYLLFNGSSNIIAIETDNSYFGDGISLNLNYGDDEYYDEDNDGVENLDGVIDFKIEGFFDFDVDYSKLCSEWEIYNTENSRKFCYGNEDCCSFIELDSIGLWNESLYLTSEFGYNNIINLRLIYFDYSLDEFYSNVIITDKVNLSAQFYSNEFTGECEETCLVTGFDKDVYKLIIDGDVTIDSISYSLSEEFANPVPVWSIIPDYSVDVGEIIEINLSQYITDDDELTFGYSDVTNLTIIVADGLVTIIPDNVIGKKYLYFTANDSEEFVVSNTIEIDYTQTINQTEELDQGVVVLGRPVKWTKKVKLNGTANNISVNISSDALNFTVLKDGKDVLDEKITVVEDGLSKTVDEYET